MVHRAPDSRLLANVIDNEKEYAKHLAALFPLARAALASLSAYAAAAADPAHARAIAGVVDVLANADDALLRYNHAVDTWRDQLAALKVLEDDLAAVLRDRDILVTRLIKASKSTRDANRSSRLVPLTGLGSASLSSLPSTNSTAVSSPTTTNSKLAQAQAELQACEAHLVAKEQELDARRISIARDGLGARCRALIDCGWVWGEMGRQGLKALQALALPNGAVSKPLPVPAYASDSSSLTPSQSASQTAARSVENSQEALSSKEATVLPDPPTHAQTTKDDVVIALPPAHAISELALPSAIPSPRPDSAPPQQPAAPPAPIRKGTRRPRRPPSQHITEASDEASDGPSTSASRHTPKPGTPLAFPTTQGDEIDSDSSSEGVHPIGPFQVVDNDPFEVIRRSMLSPSASALFLPAAPASSVARASAPDVRSSVHVDVGPSKPGLFGSPTSSGKRGRRTSMAFLGSLRGLFRKPKERGPVVTDWEDSSQPRKSSGRWVTRTDARIKGRRSGDTDDEPTQSQTGVVRRASRLRKGRPPPLPIPTRANGSTLDISRARMMDGWGTDDTGAARARASPLSRAQTRRGTTKRRKTSVADLRGSDHGHTDGEVGDHPIERAATTSHDDHSHSHESKSTPTASLRRNAPADASTPTANSAQRTPSTRGRPDPKRRSASVDAHSPSLSVSSSSSMSSSPPRRKPPPPIDPDAAFQTPPSSPSAPSSPKPVAKPTAMAIVNGRGHPSLMSVVADVTRAGSGSMDVPRAPGSVLLLSSSSVTGDVKLRGHARSASSPTTATTTGGVVVQVKMPLRSALRNASRTPSPGVSVVGSQTQTQTQTQTQAREAWRDSASVSSYETGRETLGEGGGVPSPVGESPTPTPPPPPFTVPPPPPEDPPQGDGPTTEGVGRRKSVRVSLQPTFSPTPPALVDDQGEGYAPWSDSFSGKGKRNKERQADVWADSSDEDEEYGRAKRMLSMAGKR